MQGKERRQIIKVLYICGAARSGSTILGLALHQLPSFSHVGELFHIWSRGFLQSELCSCGLEFRNCPFWNDVRERMFGAAEVDFHRMKQEMRFVRRMRRLPQILFPSLRGSEFRKAFENVSETLSKLYESVKDVSGSKVIVDSSKSPLYALLLSRLPDIELHVIHLIRDSRAVAYSWQRKKKRHQPGAGKQEMPTYKSFHSACTWSVDNSLSQILRKSAATYQRLRYEDFVKDVQRSLQTMLSVVKEEQAGSIVPAGIAASDRGHSISGNPIRFASESITIKLDDEWKGQMAKKEKWIATAATFPLLLLYRYRF